MKEAIVAKGPRVMIHNVPVPKPNADQVLIKVPHNSGDDVAGIVEAVGDNVTEFKNVRNCLVHTTFHLPKKTSFEEGASIPLAAMTAAVGLYLRLGLPEHWKAATDPIPLILYGASGAVGSYAIQLAKASNIHPIIAVAGRGHAHVEKLIDRSKGDSVVDYRSGDDAVVSGIKDALKQAGATEVKYAFDSVSEKNSYQNISQVLSKQGSKITLVIPGKDYKEIPDYVETSLTSAGSVHKGPSEKEAAAGIKTAGRDFGYVFFRLFSRGLQEGWFAAHPHEIIPGGLNGVEKGLLNLQQGVNSATKYVFRIEDT